MKKIKIIYWIFTGLMAAGLGVGAIFNAIGTPESVTYITNLGYPAYIVPFLGVAKILGIIAILIPGYPRLKEWAYAGLVFDLVGATYSHIMQGYPAAAWAPMFLFLAVVFGSYICHHKLRRLKAQAEDKDWKASPEESFSY
ncbi:DoxX-like family protein [Chitinophaga alhagiae]|uniref:DoxX-like family protein n=1 Tax=Chitinophaga alhagiae TaxID=2203219 RepID=A0ABM6WDL2_9BACT|nr:DoxX family protein [Chitinophaga alhagiae]AWO02028.1 DoxX-like family protein [Chitinophaga alhagiae]